MSSTQEPIEQELDLVEIEPEVEPKKPQELITLEQLPIIRQQLELRSIEIKKDVADALAMICTDETIITVKKTRAKLTADKTALETQRIQISKEIMKPYDAFYAIYKEKILDPYTDADAKLKAKIDALESEKKNEKEKDAMRYFAELCAAENIDFVPFEKLNLNITLNVTLAALKKQILSFVERVNSDLKLIDTQERKTEILMEYRENLDVSKSITGVTERHQKLEAQKQREIEASAARIAQSERIAQVNTFLPPPIQTPVSAPQRATEAPAQATQATGKEYSATFKAYGTIDVLKGLKAYLVSNNIRFENVPAAVPPAVPKSQQMPEPDKSSSPVAYVQFRNKEGEFGGREYSYVIPAEIESQVAAGSRVDVATRNGIVSGLVSKLGTTAEVAEEIIPKLLKLEGITKEEEGEK